MVKKYKRKLNKPMVTCLIEMYKLVRTSFAHIHNLTKSSRVFTENMHGGNFATMAYWGIIEEKPKGGEDKRTSGIWRITPLGESFIKGEARLPKYVTTYNGRAESMSSETISIEEAINNPFSYREIMAKVDEQPK